MPIIIGGFLKSLQPQQYYALIGVIFICVGAIIYGVVAWIGLFLKRHKYQVYLDRHELSVERGTLEDELKNTKKVWMVLNSGEIVKQQENIFDKVKIQRLILPGPNKDEMMKVYEPLSAPEGENEHIRNCKYKIEQIAGKALKSGTEVYYLQRGLIGESLIIADPEYHQGDEFSTGAWIRIEFRAPFLSPINRSSILVKNKDNKQYFKAMLEHYKTLLGRATELQTLRPRLSRAKLLSEARALDKVQTQYHNLTPV